MFSLSVAGIQQMSVRYEDVFSAWILTLVVGVYTALIAFTLKKVATCLGRCFCSDCHGGGTIPYWLVRRQGPGPSPHSP